MGRSLAPKVFGNVHCEPLPDICQAPGGTASPCDYIQEEFEQDCYLRKKPCGTCLLGMELLQCLQ